MKSWTSGCSVVKSRNFTAFLSGSSASIELSENIESGGVLGWTGSLMIRTQEDLLELAEVVKKLVNLNKKGAKRHAR